MFRAKGPSLAGLVTAAPWLVAAGVMHRSAAHLPCPADRAKADACRRLRAFSAWMLGISAAVWAVGFFFAFLAADLLL